LNIEAKVWLIYQLPSAIFYSYFLRLLILNSAPRIDVSSRCYALIVRLPVNISSMWKMRTVETARI